MLTEKPVGSTGGVGVLVSVREASMTSQATTRTKFNYQVQLDLYTCRSLPATWLVNLTFNTRMTIYTSGYRRYSSVYFSGFTGKPGAGAENLPLVRTRKDQKNQNYVLYLSREGRAALFKVDKDHADAQGSDGKGSPGRDGTRHTARDHPNRAPCAVANNSGGRGKSFSCRIQ